MTREETLRLLRAMQKEEKRPAAREALRVAAEELESAEYWTNRIPKMMGKPEHYEAIAHWLWGELRHCMVFGIYDPMDRVSDLQKLHAGRAKRYAGMMHALLTEYADRYQQAAQKVCDDQEGAL